MTLAFPGDKRLQTLQNKTGGGVNITKLDYTYDPAGRILSVTDQLDATNPWKATGYNGANPYDAASQLTSWQTKDTVTGTQKYNYPFSYDTSGNRTSDWLNTSYTPNNLNEIVSRTDLGGTTYTLGYDFNGNRTSDSGPTYEWNGADELSAYNFSNYRYEFSYNGDGHLWQAVKKVGGVVQNTYRYLWIGDQVREQRDSTGTTVLQKYWHNGTIINNGTQLLALRDQLGSVRELINNTSALTIRARYRYPEPYGGFPVKVSGDLDSPFQFAGYFIEPFSNLTFTGHRVYVASQGRWLNRDPLAEDGGLNLYGYVGNSPVNGIDPAGLYITWGSGTGDLGAGYAEAYSTPTGRAEIQALENSSKEIRIEKNQQEGKKGEVSSGNLPDGGLVLNSDGSRDNYTHEAQHANERLCEKGNLDPLNLGVDSPDDSKYPEGKAFSHDASENRANRASNKMEREYRQNSVLPALRGSADKPIHPGITDPFGVY